MSTLNLFRYEGMNEKKNVKNSIHGCCRGALAKFAAVIGALAFVLLVTSIISPPVSHAAFPGTNGKIAFTTSRDGNYEIYVMNADGSDPINLTNDPAYDSTPAWSPDGTKIAFESYRNGSWEIYVMNADGSDLTNLTNSSAANEANPAWSPDGTKIAFVRSLDFGGGHANLWVMNADGTAQIQLTNNVAHFPSAFKPDWSPDGTKIAFCQSLSNTNTEIYLINPDSFFLTRITSNGINSMFPDWSPDGTKIAFERGPAGSSDIYVMNPDGSDQTNLTNNGGQINQNPTWSPDGTKIAFYSFRDGNYEIYMMNTDGTGPINLTNSPGYEFFPDWQPIADTTPPDADGDGYTSDVDCNDNDPKEHPNQIWYQDADGDGYSNGNMIVQCARPTGYKVASELTATSGDCNDGDANVKPGTTEVCDGVDNDCDGSVDENLTHATTCGVGACSGNTGTETCTAGTWGNNTCNPLAGATAEICDNIDNNCDGSVDENYVFGGFQQPINSDGSSIFKAGSTIPVKIILRDCSGQSISTATVTIGVYKIADAISGTEEELLVGSSGSANTGNLFRYDATAGQYIYNLSTKSYTKGTYRVYAKPDNGNSYSVNFSLK